MTNSYIFKEMLIRESGKNMAGSDFFRKFRKADHNS